MAEMQVRQGSISSGGSSPRRDPTGPGPDERHIGFGYGRRDYPVNRGDSGEGWGQAQPERGVWTAQITQRGPRASRGPKGYTRSDERIREDVCERIVEEGLDASDVEVAVKDGEVRLAGTVSSREDKRRIEELAEEVRGVRGLESRLRASVR
ncbi:BON domain-containing protein [Sorangium sp. So ce1000]|uniref:BON domain-containing protein n=1 Tax=Sorangium sp. So ce1000 TaxID=3133325 RepID=UPI003F633809